MRSVLLPLLLVSTIPLTSCAMHPVSREFAREPAPASIAGEWSEGDSPEWSPVPALTDTSARSPRYGSAGLSALPHRMPLRATSPDPGALTRLRRIDRSTGVSVCEGC